MPRRARSGPRVETRALHVEFYGEMLDTYRRVHNACAALGMTASDFLREAARREVRRLERKHNNGKPFPDSPGDLPRTAHHGQD